MNKDRIVVTDYEVVDIDDFYLTDEDWIRERVNGIEGLRQLARNKKLYVAYIVPALDYAIYRQMDAEQVFINIEKDILMGCESSIINNKHEDVWECDI